MEILLLFVTFIAYLTFSYVGIWSAAKLTDKKKLPVQKQLTLFIASIGAMAAAFFFTFFFLPLWVVLFFAMFFAIQTIVGLSAIKSAQFAFIYTAVVVALISIEAYLVTAILLLLAN